MKIKYTVTALLAVHFTFLSSCGDKEKGHDDHAGHDHGAEGHDHGAEGDHKDHDDDKKDEHKGHDHGDHAGHDHTKAGPNGGRMVKKSDVHAEFFVTDDRKIQVTFFDAEGKAIAPSTQSVTVITGERSSPLELVLAAVGEQFISDKALPAGNNFPTAVAIKVTPEADEAVERFNLNLSECSGCDNKEYACECHH